MNLSDTAKMAFAGNNDSSTDLRVQGEAFQWLRDQLAALQDNEILRNAYQPPAMRQLTSPSPRD